MVYKQNFNLQFTNLSINSLSVSSDLVSPSSGTQIINVTLSTSLSLLLSASGSLYGTADEVFVVAISYGVGEFYVLLYINLQNQVNHLG